MVTMGVVINHLHLKLISYFLDYSDSVPVSKDDTNEEMLENRLTEVQELVQKEKDCRTSLEDCVPIEIQKSVC